MYHYYWYSTGNFRVVHTGDGGGESFGEEGWTKRTSGSPQGDEEVAWSIKSVCRGVHGRGGRRRRGVSRGRPDGGGAVGQIKGGSWTVIAFPL